MLSPTALGLINTLYGIAQAIGHFLKACEIESNAPDMFSNFALTNSVTAIYLGLSVLNKQVHQLLPHKLEQAISLITKVQH